MIKLIKYMLIFIVSLLSLSLGYAQNATIEDFTVKITHINNKIALEELAEFNLTITNNLGKEEDFRVYTLNYPDWDISTKPLINPIMVTVEPLSTKTITIFIDPLHITSVGNYLVGINVRAKRTDKLVKTDAEVTIKSVEPLIRGYMPTVVVNVNMPSSIDPRNEIPIKITLENQNMLDYPELTFRIESKTIKKELKESLDPNEGKTITLTEKIDSFTKPQKDIAVITLVMGDRIITGPLVQPIEIIKYSSIKEKLIKRFLKVTKEITVFSNDANFKGPVKIETTQLKSLFSSTKPRAKLIKEDGKKLYSFDVKLQDNVMLITIVENYVPLFIIIVLSIMSILLYFLYRSPLIIRKRAQSIEKKDGGLSRLKLVLAIKNRSKKPLQSIEIIDKVPNIVDIEKEVHLGVSHPLKILKHENKSSIIKWVIDDLGVGEERIISYRIKSKLSIIGDFTLESAFAKFKQEGKEKTTYSNTLSVTS